MAGTKSITRRRFGSGILGLSLAGLLRGQSQDHGRVNPPLPVPDITLNLCNGSSASLAATVKGHATAVQTVFTRCTTTCPMQGAIFSRVQSLIADPVARNLQLLSLSVDPDNDDASALHAWLARFHARPGWIAAAPQQKDIERLTAFFGPTSSFVDTHSTQVYIVNREGLLIWRTFELPSPEEIADILNKM